MEATERLDELAKNDQARMEIDAGRWPLIMAIHERQTKALERIADALENWRNPK